MIFYSESLCLTNIIKDISRYNFKYFFDIKNVEGVGVGYKFIKGVNTNKQCIKIFVSKKIPYDKLPFNNRIPNLYKGIITDVEESGCFYFSSLKKRVRPTTGGYSVGSQLHTLIAGSLGCLVADSKNTIYILSCNHILADSNKLPLGTPITQPAFFDGGLPPLDIIANLSSFIPIYPISQDKVPINLVDCAIAELITKDIASPIITFIGVPKGVNLPIVGNAVRKVGRTTELTSGTIKSIGTTIRISDRSGTRYMFANQIITDSMTRSGDSGSILLNSNDEAIGLNLASSPNHSVFNTIFDVLIGLRVRIVTSI